MLTRLKRLMRRCSRADHRKNQALSIGDGSRVNHTFLDGMFPELVKIGRNCIMAPGAMVLTHDASYYLHTGKYRVSPVNIGDDVFIGYGAMILPGVTIGCRSIIGAGSVVTGDIPSDSVAAGIPARVICSIQDFIDNANEGQLLKPPYGRKAPSEITRSDVEKFRAVVMAKYQGCAKTL